VPKGDGIATVAKYEDGEVCFINLNNGRLIE
jgi:hypothetical protein